MKQFFLNQHQTTFIYVLCIALCKGKVGFVKFTDLFDIINFRNKKLSYEMDKENKFSR